MAQHKNPWGPYPTTEEARAELAAQGLPATGVDSADRMRVDVLRASAAGSALVVGILLAVAAELDALRAALRGAHSEVPKTLSDAMLAEMAGCCRRRAPHGSQYGESLDPRLFAKVAELLKELQARRKAAADA